MHHDITQMDNGQDPALGKWLSLYAIFGTLALMAAILVADAIVPDHDWIADTISDLGAGKYEFIVDTGLYAYSASFIALSLLAAHCHMGGAKWSLGLVGLALLGMIVFLVGARNEYGDGDNEGVVIHIYLVYALGALLTLVPWLMSEGVAKVSGKAAKGMIAFSIVWTLSAPIFFFLPDSVDGIYERYLGLLAGAFTIGFAWFFKTASH